MKSKPVPVALEAVGRSEGSKEVEIRARVSGILQKQLYEEGSFVRAGSPQGQMVFSAACGGEYSPRERAAHIDGAVEGFLAIYGSRES